MSAVLATVLVIATGLVAGAGTRALIPLLRRRALLDRPNERSLHRHLRRPAAAELP